MLGATLVAVSVAGCCADWLGPMWHGIVEAERETEPARRRSHRAVFELQDRVMDE